MKIVNTLLICLFCLASALPASAVDVEDGVSRVLAEYRSANISDVRYSLTFLIPQAKDVKVCGRASLSFSWKGRQDLQIDFQGDASQFDGTCTINGQRRRAAWKDEHIIIPNAYLRQGRNIIKMNFTSGDKSLNRSGDYLYTLFVPDHARSVFPCFDQSDLKARFSLTLRMPDGWQALSNGKELLARPAAKVTGAKGYQEVSFQESDPIPTYLFSFTAGKFFSRKTTKDGYEMEALYRETDTAKVAQLDKVFGEVALSLRWLEQYTGIKQPFQKYGFVILPGYQFGGMEHPGAIQFRDQSIFLGKNPTPDEELNRLELIAHETTHLWFGDMVTMRWFNDVWTKEVFANFMAAKISRQQFPDINHDLNFLKSYQVRALSTDRTDGTHPIQQPLDNLKNAGLLYGNIIYDKAPVMMRKLEEQMGAEAFRSGLQKYLHKFAFSNATWDDLISILDKESPSAGILDFSEVWVKQKGLPTIETRLENGALTVSQTDVFGRGIFWKQKIGLQTIAKPAGGSPAQSVHSAVDMQQATVSIPADTTRISLLIPNDDGSGYGRFLLSTNQIHYLESSLSALPDIQRFAAMMNLYENYLMHRADRAPLYLAFYRTLCGEKNQLVASSLCDYAFRFVRDMAADRRHACEEQLFTLSRRHPLPSVRQKLTRLLYANALDSAVCDSIYQIWINRTDTLMNERDYLGMAYHLAIMRPAEWQQIIDTQRERLKNADVIREFDFVSRACNPSTEIQADLFRSLLNRENRAVEPWAAQLLALLNTEIREPQANRYITPALDELQEIQRTGDIFFPGDWLYCLLSGHKSEEAKQLVLSWIAAHHAYPVALMNKLKENAYFLLRSE